MVLSGRLSVGATGVESPVPFGRPCLALCFSLVVSVNRVGANGSLNGRTGAKVGGSLLRPICFSG